jgi:chromosome segregation ATPase
MSTKKTREPRKPLNESFLEFVHGNSPDLEPTSDSSAEVPADDESLLQLTQELVILQQRLAQLEQRKAEPDLKPIQQLDAQVAQLLQRLSQLEQQAEPFTQLHQRLAELEQRAANWPSLAQFEDYLAQHSQQVAPMANNMTPQQLPTDLLERFEALESVLKEQGDRAAQSFHQIESQINTLNQHVGQLRADVRQLSGNLQHYLDGSVPVLTASQPTLSQAEEHRVPAKAASSLPPIGSNGDSFHSSSADPLLSRLSSILDDF